MQSLKGSASQILIAGATAKSAPHLQRITDLITDIKSGGNMNDTSTKVFLALQRIAVWVFADCYVNRDKPRIALNELFTKKTNYWIIDSKIQKETLERLNDNEISVGEFCEENTTITIKVNSFKCSFSVYNVFELLTKFAKLAREEKVLSNAQIKQYCTFEKIFGLVEQTKREEQKVEQAKPVIVTIEVEQSKQKPQVTSNPYGGDYAALLAAQINQLINVPF